MFTLSLDEYGDFEHLENKKDAILIAGIVYDDNDVQYEDNTERKRIGEYYRSVVREVNEETGGDIKYPDDLHMNSKINGTKVAAVKKKVSETLREFLTKGTFHNSPLRRKENNQWKDFPKRAGKYYLFAVLNSERGMTERLGENAGFLLNDNEGYNLYKHMVSEVLDRCVFNTSFAPRNSRFTILIATRTSPVIDKESKKAREYRKLGCAVSDTDRNTGDELRTSSGKPAAVFTLTNQEVYCSSVSQKLIEDNPENAIILDISAKSTNYGNDKAGHEYFYLADSICSFFSFKLAETGENESEWLAELQNRMNRLLPEEQQLLFGYDSADIQLSKALKYYHQEDYYGALSACFEAKNDKSAFGKFYYEKWFSLIEKRIEQSENLDAFRRTVACLRDSQTTNKYRQDFGLYVLSEMESQAESIKQFLNLRESKRVLYQLYECGMTAYCHMGDSKKAERYFNKLEKYADSMPMESFLQNQNRLAVCLCDALNFEKALFYANRNADNCGILTQYRSLITGADAMDCSLEEAKALSQQGQVYAFMQNEKAEECFDKSLRRMASKSADYYITLSYLLHYYLDSGKTDQYQKMAREYFGNRMDLEQRLDYILEEGTEPEPRYNLRFALYVLVKGAYLLEEEITETLWEKLSDIVNYINDQYGEKLRHKFDLLNHPGGLISKYLALIAIRRKDMETAKRYIEIIDFGIAEKASPIISAYLWKAKYDIAEAIQDTESGMLAKTKIVQILAEMGVIPKEETDAGNPDKCIATHITYMYN